MRRAAALLFLGLAGCASSTGETTILLDRRGRRAPATAAVLPLWILLDTGRPGDPPWKEPFHMVFQKGSEEGPSTEELPEDLNSRGRIWLGERNRYRLLLSPETSVKIARSMGNRFSGQLERTRRYIRTVDPPASEAMLATAGLEQVLRVPWPELDLPENRTLFHRAGLRLGVDYLVIGALKRYDTEIVQRTVPSAERAVRGAEATAAGEFTYTFHLTMETALFDVNAEQWVWRAEKSESQRQRTAEVRQDLATALASGRWSPFVKNWLLDQMLEKTPEERCVKSLISALTR